MVNFGPLMAEIDLLVWGTPSYFNGYRVFISGRQANFAALNRGRHLYSAERSSRWALAHISSALSLLCPQEGCNVLQSACLSVCLSGCMSQISFYGCYQWLWLGPALRTVQYIIYFQFSGCCHISHNTAYVMYGKACGRRISVSRRQHRLESGNLAMNE